MIKGRAVPALVCALVLSAVAASPALGAKVSLKDGETFGTVTYRAAAGETNDVVLKLRAKSVTASDKGARIRAGKGCRRRPGGTVECALRATVITHIARLGDGDDRVRLARGKKTERTGSLNARGGDGDDILDARRASHPTSFLYGGPGADRLTGGPMGDVLYGDAGSDRLDGRDGIDVLRPDDAASADADVLIGGDGSDFANYEARSTPVRIDLRRASPQGSEGEADSFQGIENVKGTAGDDVILGDAGDNDLLGGAGSDELRGFEGNDRVWGEDEVAADTLDAGPGRDIVNSDAAGSTGTGGDGDDSLNGRGTLDGGAGRDNFEPDGATVVCGADDDGVVIVSVAPSALDASCEGIAFGRQRALGMTLPVKRAEGGLVARLGCDEDDTGEIDMSICSGDLTASVGDAVVASGTYSGAAGLQDRQMPYRPGGKEALGSEPKQVRLRIGTFTIDVVV